MSRLTRLDTIPSNVRIAVDMIETFMEHYKKPTEVKLEYALKLWYKYHKDVLCNNILSNAERTRQGTLLFLRAWEKQSEVQRTTFIVELEKKYDEEIHHVPLLWNFS